MITSPAILEWYRQLKQPPLTPPDWVFGPVWTLLYFMMAVAAWLVWKERGGEKGRGALVLFFMQLLLNGIWPLLFFGLRRPDLAFIEILVLCLAIGMTVVSFWKAYRPAGVLLLPYWAWVGFAIYLNLGFWLLNR